MSHLCRRRTRDLLGVFAFLLLLTPAIAGVAQSPDGPALALERARAAGAYRFTARIEQTLIPRPLPSMVGRTDERVIMAAEGEVTLPDQSRMELRLEGGGLDLPALTLVQDGVQTYVLRDGERVEVENQLALTAPTVDYLGYLAAMENVRRVDEPSPDGSTHYAYDLDGPRLAAYVSEQLEASLRGSLPVGASLAPSPVLQRMNGHAELWMDAAGLPRRQVLDLDLPEVSREYDARAHISVDFEFDDTGTTVAGTSRAATVAVSHGTGGSFGHVAGLLMLASIGAALVAYRRHRWVRGLVVVSVALILVVSPPLQALGYARFQERRGSSPAVTLTEALGLQDSAVAPSRRSAAPWVLLSRASGLPSSLQCGAGDVSHDSDEDGLNDAAEACLGTDPSGADSDGDLITDTLEIDGFAYAGRTWTADPLRSDSNGDGMTDGAEWPAPVGYAPDLEGVADDRDTDGDGVPNLWDADNDEDGVTDDLDLSPFSRTAYTSTFVLSTQAVGFDGYQTIEVQIQPQTEAHLRYNDGVLDWPIDSQGQITDTQTGDQDLRLVPMLRIRANRAPAELLAQTYGVAVSNEGEIVVLMAPLIPVGAQGQTMAYAAKVAYGPGELDDIRWTFDVLWMVYRNAEPGVVQSTLLQTYPGGAFRVSGIQITKSRGFRSAILGTPGFPDDDRRIFQLLFGLSATFLNNQGPGLAELQTRFANDNTDIVSTWSVPAVDVAIDLTPAYEVVDVGLFDTVARSMGFLTDPAEGLSAYPNDSTPSLITAFQQEVGSYTLDDGGRRQPGTSLNVNLAGVPVSTQRGLRAESYTRESGGWRAMTLKETLDKIQERYADLTATLAELQTVYPELTAADLHGVLALFYASWYLGQERQIVLDGRPFVPASRPDAEVYDSLTSSPAVSLPAYLLDVANLGQEGAGLRISSAPATIWALRHALGPQADEMSYLELASITFGDAAYDPQGSRSSETADGVLDGWDNFSTARDVVKAIRALAGLGEVAGDVAKAAKAAGKGARTMRVLGAIFDGLDIAAWGLSVGFAIAEYNQMSDQLEQLPESSGLRKDLQTSLDAKLAATIVVYSLVLFLSVGPWGLIGALIGFLDLILSLATGVGFLDDVIGGFQRLFGGVTHVLSNIDDLSFSSPTSGLRVPEAGMVAGNTFQIRSTFAGTIASGPGGIPALQKSTIAGRIEAGAHTGEPVLTDDRQGPSSCVAHYYYATPSKLICENTVQADYLLLQAHTDVALTLSAGYTATTYHEVCQFSCSERTDVWDELGASTPITVDVLPPTLDGLWVWNPGGHVANLDRDGDGLANSVDPDPNAWDADGDRLGDKFEADLGTQPDDPDTDGDGLPDGFEIRLGTDPQAGDSDGDGLVDCRELSSGSACGTSGPWAAGWLVTLPGVAAPARVFPDPREGDADGDGLSDGAEAAYGTSPYAVNGAPRLRLEAAPLALSPNGTNSTYVRAGDGVTLTLTLDSIGPLPITSTLALCLPDWLTDLQGGSMLGDRTPPAQTAGSGTCPDGHGLTWSFGDSATLQLWESVSTTLTARVQNPLSSSAFAEVEARLPYQVGSSPGEITVRVAIVADADSPDVAVLAPLDGALLGGGTGFYVIGGTATDSATWIDRVELELPGNGGPITATGTGLWAFTWELPSDGSYTLQIRSYDQVGHESAPAAVQVTVDNTQPGVSLDWDNGGIFSPTPGEDLAIALTGGATDNLSGLVRVQVSTDGRPWREAWAGTGAPQSVSWSTTWRLGTEASAQGVHVVAARSWDLAGNISRPVTRTVLVDVVPPTDELTNRTYLEDPPHVAAGQVLTLHGVANDAGRLPPSARPAELAGTLDTLGDAAIWLGLPSVTADDGGVRVAWLGDFNGDRLADLVVGLPGANPTGLGAPAGTVSIITGRAGGWPVPADVSLLTESRSAFMGEPGAGLGARLAAPGDCNGDGFSDLAIGDPAGQRVFVVYGRSAALGQNIILDGPSGKDWAVIDLQGLGDLAGLAAAGDVNGDGRDDLLIGTRGPDGLSYPVYLLPGRAGGWRDTVSLAGQAAAIISTDAWDATPNRLGDLDRDGYDEFAITSDTVVHLFRGDPSYHTGGRLALGLADGIDYANAMHPAGVTPLGDVNADGFADFAMASSMYPRVVFGDADLGDDLWTSHTLIFDPPSNGLMAAPGDVDADGRADLLLRSFDGGAYLVLGSDLSHVAATFTDVIAAASVPYAAGGDLNSDGSSDLLLVPSEPEFGALSAHPFGEVPYIDPAWLPVATHISGAEPASLSLVQVDAAQATLTVDDDGCAGCYATIQGAIDAAGDGDEILVQPGVYAPFEIDGKSNLTVSGVHPDAAFVDGGGGDAAVRIAYAGGVRIADLTLRNAGHGVVLAEAGVGGTITSTLRIVLDRLLVQSVAESALAMDRTSTVALNRCTLVGDGQAGSAAIQVTGPADPGLASLWTPVSTTITAPHVGGGIVAGDAGLYLLPGAGSTALFATDTGLDDWRTAAPVPITVTAATAAAAGTAGSLHVAVPEQWSPLGGGLACQGEVDGVQAVTLDADGNLYAGGTCSEVGGVARWDGDTWTSLGANLTCSGPYCVPSASVLATDGSGRLYVGGQFSTAGGVPADNIAMWNGLEWLSLGAPSGSLSVDAMAVDSSGILYVVQYVWTPEQGNQWFVRRWYDGTWSTLGSTSVGFDAFVAALAVDNLGNVYAGGGFASVDGVAANGIARWNGSTWQPLGSGLAGPSYPTVLALAVDENGALYAGGRFATAGGVPAVSIARWFGGAWSAVGTATSGPDARVLTLATDAGGILYAGGEFATVGGVATGSIAWWDGSVWRPVGAGISGVVRVRDIAVDETHSVITGGQFATAGGRPALNIARASTLHYRYSPVEDSWSELERVPLNPVWNLALGGDGSGFLYALGSGHQPELVRYETAPDVWSLESTLPFTPGIGSALVVTEQYLYALSGGDTAFWRYDRVSGAWTPLESVPAVSGIAAGASLAWDGEGSIFALAGGNGRHLLRYDIAGGAWYVVGDGNTATPDQDTPAPVNAGGDLAFAGGQLAFVPGGDVPGLWRLLRPSKLMLENVAFVAPATAPDVDWLTFNDEPLDLLALPQDFGIGGAGNAWVAGSGTIWSVEPALAASAVLTYDQADFLSVEAGVYRIGSGSTLAAGYHTYRPDAVVATESAEFGSIQAAIESGANRVLVRPGGYAERFNLLSGVHLAGAGAGQTIVSPAPGGTATGIVRAEGVVGAALSGLTLAGDGVVDGLQVEDGAQSVTAARLIIRGTAAGIRVDGAATGLEVINATIVGNEDGLVASGCAGVDVRNTVFAYHSGTGLGYAPCAPVRRHTYSDYWANGTDIDDGSAQAAVSPGELFLDPLFVSLADHDYRTLDASPVIDAGDPGDPSPPGTGGRVDIGYLEQGRAAYYADDDYCEFCTNDGLTWQVDAFDAVQAALNAAALGTAALRFPEQPPQVTVGVGQGSYTETLTVPSYVRLVGSGAEATVIEAGGGAHAVTFDGVVHAELNGFTVRGATTAGVAVLNAANTITLTANLVLDNTAGVVFDSWATGRVAFNTVVGSTGPAVSSGQPGTWIVAEGNVLSGNGIGLHSQGGQLFHDYNLLDNTDNFDGADLGQAADELVAVDPGFAGGVQPYRLLPVSPGVDAASPYAAVPAGGGTRADMGYSEVLAPPLVLFMGKEGTSSTTGNSGVAEVRVGITLADPTQPVTATLPAVWDIVSLASPGATVSYWQRQTTPGAEGTYRVYSRAGDIAANVETAPEDWYEGAFVVDGTAPVVTWLSPVGGAGVTSPLELRAEVSDYPGGRFGVAEIAFVVDGEDQAAHWAAEPWQARNEEPRVFRTWIDLPPGAHTLRAVAQDRAGHVGQSAPVGLTVTGATAPDLTPPTLEITSPAAGEPLSRTVAFAGTAGDGGVGLASVEVSLDGGFTWVPASVSSGQWTLSWEAPEGQDYVSYPVKVTARDLAGNATVHGLVATVDTQPPALPATVDLSVPEGSHLDALTALIVDWHAAPTDGSGGAVVLLTADQMTGTWPTEERAGTTAVLDLNAPGPWYVHLAVRDPAGNQRVRHIGPWSVGTFSETSVPFGQRQQTIKIDGILDIGHREWRVDTELLDDDESERGPQSLYATWDGDTLYLGWQGAWWMLDGTLWAYLETGAAGTTQPVEPVQGLVSLPLQAAYAVSVTGRNAADGALWAYGGGSWQRLPAPLEFAHGSGGGTEIRIPLSSDQLGLLALAVDDNGWAWSVFPTAREAASGMTALAQAQVPAVFTWTSLSGTSAPNLGQPQGTSVDLALGSPQAPEAAWGPGDSLTTIVDLTNREARQVEGLQVALSAGPGLTYDSVAGATCADCSAGDAWVLDVPALLPEAGHRITVTGHVALSLGLIESVSSDVTLRLDGAVLAQDAIRHRVDGEPPLLTVSLPPGNAVGSGWRAISGIVSDAGGSGVAQVSVLPQGAAGWQPATGTTYWTAQVEFPVVPDGQVTSFTVAVQATDAAGNWSEANPTFSVDAAAPDLGLTVPVTLTGSYAVVSGTARDALPAGSRVVAVEVQVDDAGGPWLPVSTLGEPDATGLQQWASTWLLPRADHDVYSLRARARDAAGNEVITGWQETTVDNVAPQITVTTAIGAISLSKAVAEGSAAATDPWLAGTAGDGSGVRSVTVLVYAPDGQAYREPAEWDGLNWRYLPGPGTQLPGTYALRVEVIDTFGNTSMAGPFEVSSGEVRVYLPMVQR